MSKGDLFSIVIPCKNEEKSIGILLDTISKQSVLAKKIVIADANSTDNTVKIVKSYKNLNIKLIKGGPVGYGRNRGAKFCSTKYIIFIDADMELNKKDLLEKTIDLMEKEKHEMSTTNIRCSSKNVASDFIYILNNVGQRISKMLNSPFSTGAFMCVAKEKFDKLGGFDEAVTFAEDYCLSKQIDKSKFGIVNSKIYTSDRRFKKMGYFWMIKNFIKSYFNRNNPEYFKKDFKYWV
jgi:glycosyltransferase involved in cell wall biosynthesis